MPAARHHQSSLAAWAFLDCFATVSFSFAVEASVAWGDVHDPGAALDAPAQAVGAPMRARSASSMGIALFAE